ncbi:MAG: hypothetical protein HC773_30360, partial [Scytonema sp. CRU_2_7]|nr:hypothetical protein [Scytonema sp. CRU_2_7]
PNGDLLVIYEGVGDTPWGYGLAKFDRDSNVVWKYLEQVHHDVEVHVLDAFLDRFELGLDAGLTICEPRRNNRDVGMQ